MNTSLCDLTLNECISLLCSYVSMVLLVLCCPFDSEFNACDLYLGLLHMFLMMPKGRR